MNLEKLKVKREKLAEKIRQAEQREREHKERHLLKVARKHGLLSMDEVELEARLAKIAVATESEPPSDTVAPKAIARTPSTDRPETALETPKKKWGLS